VRCLNEAVVGSCRNVLRPWHTRLQEVAVPLRSNSDEEEEAELLLHIPFDGAVKLKALSVICRGPPGTAPSRMRAFTNREGLDFAAAAAQPPVQEWELVPDGDVRGVIEYPTQVSRFTGVHCLDLWLTGAAAAAARRRQAVEAVYEVRPVPGDAGKIPGIGQGANWSA
ncbi:hypothetical protein TSOC_007289, partial [Tetrabaena socialis]